MYTGRLRVLLWIENGHIYMEGHLKLLLQSLLSTLLA